MTGICYVVRNTPAPQFLVRVCRPLKTKLFFCRVWHHQVLTRNWV